MTWAAFNDKFFEGRESINWFDRKGVLQLNNGLMAEITLSTNGTKDHYEGYLVSVISKDRGQLSRHFFKFDEYMSESIEKTTEKGFKIVGYCCKGKVDWYINHPTAVEVRYLANQILSYINQWE